MNRYFFISDIHSCYDAMVKSLKSAGFKKSNAEHILVVCGDIFDNGDDALKVFKYLTAIPENRRFMIRGNHEYLYLELLSKNFPDESDFLNGTVKTFCTIADVNYQDLDVNYQLSKYYKPNNKNRSKEIILDTIKRKWLDVRDKVKSSDITKWLESDEWTNFFELDNLICVHSFIPLKSIDCEETKWVKNYPTYKLHPKLLECVPEWRSNASYTEWKEASWGCPYRQFAEDLFESEISNNPDVKLVCGHWKASEFHNYFEDDNSLNLNMYFSRNLVALDACSEVSGFCNILIYDQESGDYFDRFKNKLILNGNEVI